jgi:PAS domain S-box-containing protein
MRTVTLLVSSSRAAGVPHGEADRLKLALESAAIGTWVYDPVAPALSLDEVSRGLFGLPQGAEVSWELLAAVKHPDDRARSEAALRGALDPSGTGSLNDEFRILSPGVRERFIHATARTFFEQGRTVLCVGTLQDVSSHRRADAERERFFLLAPDLFCIAGLDGYFRKVNNAFVAALGYDEAELYGRSFLELIHPDDRRGTLDELASLSRGKPTLRFENRYRCKDGSYKWLAWSAQPVPEEGFTYAAARDITERKQAEAERESFLRGEQRARAEVEAAKAQLTEIFENVPAIVGVVRAPDQRYILANPGLRALYGHRPLLGRTRREAHPELEGQAVPDLVDSVFRTGQQVSRKDLFVRIDRHNDGHLEEGYFTVIYQPLKDADGSVQAAVLFAVENTEEVRARQQAAALSARLQEGEARLRLLVEATRILGSSLQVESTLGEVARVVVPHFADWCAIDLLDEEGLLARAAVAHTDPSKVTLAWELWRRAPPRPDDAHGAYAAMRTGRPELLEDLTDEILAEVTPDAEALALLRSLGLRSAITVPIAARERTLGALTLVVAESSRRYEAEDVKFAEELGRRVAIAIDNSRLYAAAEQARAVAEAFAAEVTEQRRAVEEALLTMRAERDRAIARAASLESAARSSSDNR